MNLKPANPRRFAWEKALFPVTFKAYLFNITNPIEFVEGRKVWHLIIQAEFLKFLIAQVNNTVSKLPPVVFDWLSLKLV